MAVREKAAEEGLAELLRLYRDAQRIIAAMVREAVTDGNLGRRDALRKRHSQIVAFLDQLGFESDPIARRLIANAWTEGDASVMRALPDKSIGVTFGAVNRGAMEAIQDALVASLGDARATVGRRVFDVYRRAGLRSVTLGLLGARGSGRAVSADLVQRLKAQGVKSFIDRAGRAWDLRDYADMVARTTTREAVVAAQLQRMAQQGIDLARVSTSSNPCVNICLPWQGRLVSLDGARSSFHGEPAATLDAMPNGGPPYHPRCRHYLEPVSTLFSGE